MKQAEVFIQDFFCGILTEDEDVIITYKVVHLYVCTIHCTDSNCTVKHELHVTGTAGLL